MVELQALGRVRGRERQQRVVAPQLREPATGVRDGREEGGQVGVGGGPGKDRRREPRLGSTGRSRTRPVERDQQRLARFSTSRRHGQDGIEARVLERKVETRRPERDAVVIATMTAGMSSRFVRARTARVDPSSGQRRIARPNRTGSSAASGARSERAIGGRAGPDPLRESLAVAFDEANRPLDDRPRAPVVDLEVDPPEAGQHRVQAEDTTHVGQAPAVDRLVVVADQQDPVRRFGEEQGEAELGAIDVLDLVDEQMARTGTASGRAGPVPLERVDGAEDEVVEVEPAGRRDRGLVVDERARERDRPLDRRRPPRP